MSAPVCGYIVTLEKDTTAEDAEEVAALLRHLRGVGSVRPVEADGDHLMAKEQARLQLWEQVSAVFWRRP